MAGTRPSRDGTKPASPVFGAIVQYLANAKVIEGVLCGQRRIHEERPLVAPHDSRLIVCVGDIACECRGRRSAADGHCLNEVQQANTIKAAVREVGLLFYRYAGGVFARMLSVPMINIIDDGKHADNPCPPQWGVITPSFARNGVQGKSSTKQTELKTEHLLGRSPPVRSLKRATATWRA